MINVQALQSTLSAMSLPQIQQYAALHKNDPYVVSMALSIANTKKEAMTAQQGMAGQRPMPKVVDQDIAAIAPQQPMVQAAPAAPMLPEEQGIGQLPAPNIQGMCGGGIVAFEEGGEVPRFQGQGPSQVPSSTTGYAIPGMAQSDLYARAKAKYDAGQPLTSTEKALLFSAAPLAAAGDVLMSPINAVRNLVRNPLDTSPAPSMTPFSDARANALYGDTSLQPTSASLGRSPSNAEIEQMMGLGALPAAPGFKTESNVPLDGATPTTAQSTRATSMANAPVAPGVPSASSYIERFKKELPTLETAPTKEEIAKEYGDVYAPLNDKMQAMLDKERGKLSSDKEEAAFMAMIRGGLAAAGGTSPFGLTNLAKGFEQGAVDYAGSLKDLRQAAKEQTKLEMDFEKAKADQAAGNIDRYYKRLDTIEDRNAKIRHLQASGVAGLLGDEMRSAATIAAANAMPPNMRAALALGTGDTQKERLESGLAKLNALGAERTDLTFAKMYADHVADARRAMQEPMSPTAFAATIRSALSAYKPRVVDTDKPSGVMYDRP